MQITKNFSLKVSTHSRLKAAGASVKLSANTWPVSTHSRLKAAGTQSRWPVSFVPVSTHSRLKAAGQADSLFHSMKASFNTQPPEGGWLGTISTSAASAEVSTHSRLKAAGRQARHHSCAPSVSTHSRLKAAGSCCFRRPATSSRFQHTAA